ncbi:MAG: CPBP family intramembrane metalloprotease [Candidatus Hydrogenedentes bacterium]|nr:CPBP family intramembrane metalloprotease [Candidatus Hydrogenedentota bacterium]
MRVLRTAFLALLALHVVYAAHRNRRVRHTDPIHPELHAVFFSAPPFIVTCLSALKPRTPRDILAGYLQFVLFGLACVLGAEQEVFTRRLISPVDIGLGLLVAHLVFGVSLLITQTSVREAVLHLIDFNPIWTFVVENPAILMQYVIVSVAEEMTYRVGAQPALIALLGTPWLAILVVAVVFCVVHEHFFKNPTEQSSEFFAFAMLLGALYYWTGSLILVIVIHAVRNIEIAFLEELLHMEACGGDELAGIERQYALGTRAAVLLAGPGVRGDVVCLEYVRTPIAPAHAMESI